MSFITKPKISHPSLPRNELGLTRRDYEGGMSTLCAGCGHDSVTAAVIEAIWGLSIRPEMLVKLSGIGCSSKTTAYFDSGGLYAFSRQPEAVVWNLTRFAECLLPLGEHAALEASLNTFWPVFRTSMWAAVLRRLGLSSLGEEKDAELVVAIFAFLNETQIPYERFWFDWRGGLLSDARADQSPVTDAYRAEAFNPIRWAFNEYKPSPTVNLDHPYFARSAPRSMLIEEMEALWAPIAETDDWTAFNDALGEIEEMRQAYAGDAKSSARPGISS